MVDLKMENEIKTKFAEIKGLNCNGSEWDLNTYVSDMTFRSYYVKIYFIYKYFMTFEIMEQLKELFNEYDLKVEADSDRLVLVMEVD